MKLSFSLAITIVIIAVVGCSKTDDKKKNTPAANKATTGDTKPMPSADTKTAPDTKTTKTTKDTPTKTAPKIAVDADVLGAIHTVAKDCKIASSSMSIKCSNGERKKLTDIYVSSKPRSRVETIGTLATALGSADAKVQTVAASLLARQFKRAWGTDAKAGSVSPDVVKALLAALPKLGKYQGRNAIPAIAHAAILANQKDALYKVLDAHSDTYLRHQGYIHSAFYGRMNVFDKAQALAKSTDAGDRLAAVQMVSRIPKYTDAEKTLLCPWALEQAKFDADEKESEVFKVAGTIAIYCRGGSIDKLLDFGEAQLKKNKFNRQYYFVYRNVCFSMVRKLLEEPGIKKQCQRNYKFLEKVVNSPKIEAEWRAYALDAISYQRRDAKSLRLMQRYKNHKVKEIKKTAREAITMLKGYVKGK